MDRRDIAQAFANGATKGRASNLFIDGNTIYSYGYHFPIAVRRGDGKVAFNSDSYSVTTAKHKGAVRSALHGRELVYLNTNEMKEVSRLENDLT